MGDDWYLDGFILSAVIVTQYDSSYVMISVSAIIIVSFFSIRMLSYAVKSIADNISMLFCIES